MITWLSQNWGSIVAVIIVAAILALIIWKLVRDRKKGKNSCGCDCSNCPGCAVKFTGEKKDGKTESSDKNTVNMDSTK